MPSSALPLSVATVTRTDAAERAFAGPILEGDEVRRVTQRRVVSALVRICFLCITLIVCLSEPLAAPDLRDRIICREQVSAGRRETLAEKLRGITHLPVSFDENGVLRGAEASADGGSQTARDLISKGLAGSNVILLEDASGRQDGGFLPSGFGQIETP
jgi:hypothetical protein